jgi:uncharacterized membrane protein
MNPLIQFPQLRFVRIWELSECEKRSILKTITWRVTGSSATFLIAYILTGNFAIASVIGITQMISNTLLYYVHERLWNRIDWGKSL